MSANNVKLIFINGIGPVLAVIQSEEADAIVVRNPCQFDVNGVTGELTIHDYLEGISDPEKTVIFMKYNIISISTPYSYIADVYVNALEALNDDKPKLIVPEQKIIL